MNKILEQDIENIIKNFDMELFRNKTILITGATGLLGKLCAKSILQSKVHAKVIALVRNEQKAKKIFKDDNALKIVIQDINTKIEIEEEVDYIIHCASVTSSKDFVEKPVETILTAINGTNNVLEFAKNKKNLKGVVYLSSLEVYGERINNSVKEENMNSSLFEKISPEDIFTESDMGYIDNLNPRSSYSEGKRMVETLCISYGKEYNLPIKIVRLAQTFGAGVEKSDNRVFAQFAKSIINKENIIIHTEGKTARNYCYTTDAIRGIFTVLIFGENNNAYNIANKNTFITIANMAKLLENENSKLQKEIDNKNRGYNPTIRIFLDTKKLESLGWCAKINLKEMFERTIKSMQEDNE